MLPPFTRFIGTMSTKPMSDLERLDSDLRTVCNGLQALSDAAGTLGLDGFVDRLGPIRSAAMNARKTVAEQWHEQLAERNKTIASGEAAKHGNPDGDR